MERSGYAVAASVGAAIGFGAFGWLLGAGLALAIGCLVTGARLRRDALAGHGVALRGYMKTPVLFEHAAIWCCALLGAVLFVRAWG